MSSILLRHVLSIIIIRNLKWVQSGLSLISFQISSKQKRSTIADGASMLFFERCLKLAFIIAQLIEVLKFVVQLLRLNVTLCWTLFSHSYTWIHLNWKKKILTNLKLCTVNIVNILVFHIDWVQAKNFENGISTEHDAYLWVVMGDLGNLEFYYAFSKCEVQLYSFCNDAVQTIDARDKSSTRVFARPREVSYDANNASLVRSMLLVLRSNFAKLIKTINWCIPNAKQKVN